MERRMLGNEVTWSDAKCRFWVENNAMIAVKIIKDESIVGYGSALCIKKESFLDIHNLQKPIWSIDNTDLSVERKFWVIGAVLVEKNWRKKGLASMILERLEEETGSNLLADAFSEEAALILLKRNWKELGKNPERLFIHNKYLK